MICACALPQLRFEIAACTFWEQWGREESWETEAESYLQVLPWKTVVAILDSFLTSLICCCRHWSSHSTFMLPNEAVFFHQATLFPGGATLTVRQCDTMTTIDWENAMSSQLMVVSMQ